MPTIAKNIFLLVVLAVAAKDSLGQGMPQDSLQTVVAEITSRNVYEKSSSIGYAAAVSEQYRRFRWLVSSATVQQLTNLAARHKNAVVRLYAFQALKQKHASIAGDLLKQFQHDETMVETLEGCIGEKKTVKELAAQNLRPALTGQ